MNERANLKFRKEIRRGDLILCGRIAKNCDAQDGAAKKCEVMYAYFPDMEKAYEKHGVELNVHIGEGMMHCWRAMEFVPEAKAVRQEYFRALK
ncbi:MAG: hypothetical protein NC347_15730 [Clostridium sp.]|nr:hypothetical protein [Clostridium sp.]